MILYNVEYCSGNINVLKSNVESTVCDKVLETFKRRMARAAKKMPPSNGSSVRAGWAAARTYNINFFFLKSSVL